MIFVSVFAYFQFCLHLIVFVVQKQIVRILVMVPIYAVDSFLSFRFYRFSVYLDLFRDCYEAFVIYTFVMLCVNLMGGEPHTIELLKQRPKPIKLPLPFCCVLIPQERYHVVHVLSSLTTSFRARKFLRRVMQGCLQYVVIRPITTVIAVVLHIAGVCKSHFIILPDRCHIIALLAHVIFRRM